MACHHLQNSCCRVAAALLAKYGLNGDCIASEAACRACQRLTTPQQPNSVTLDLACLALRKSGRAGMVSAFRQQYPDLWDVRSGIASPERLDPIESGQGVGSELWRLLASLGIKHQPGCHCLKLAEGMNALGPDGCRRDRGRLVEAMRVNADSYGWGDVATAVANAAKNAAVAAVHLERVWIPNPLDPYGSLLYEAIRRAETAVA